MKIISLNNATQIDVPKNQVVTFHLDSSRKMYKRSFDGTTISNDKIIGRYSIEIGI